MDYKKKKNCPVCGVPESWVISGGPSLADSTMTYSCEHFEAESKLCRCRFCGKPGAPVRQVPLPIRSARVLRRFVDACREHYGPASPSRNNSGQSPGNG